ncbi:MAG: ABC transporter permease, partial [Silvibacterium sp.]
MLTQVLADLKHAMRQLRRSTGFAVTAVLTVALGIGATTAIFTLVHAVLLKSLPVEDPAGLWRVGDNEQCCMNGGLPDYQDPVYDWSLFSYRQYEQFRDHTPGFGSLAAFESSDHEMAVRRAGSDQPAQPWYGEFVSGNSFDTLGLRPYAGRLLRPSDDDKGAAPVAVISFQAWEQELGRDPSVIGSSLTINGQPVSIIGIAPPGFYSERLSPT